MVEEQITVNQQVQVDYYGDNTGKKIGDFCLGFFGTIIFGAIISSLIPALDALGFIALFLNFFPLLGFIGYIWALVKFDKVGRKFIKRGMLAVPLLLVLGFLLLLGACIINPPTW